jgi:hypothetical protein
MEYRQIVAVTGLTGLYQLVSTKNDGALVRSLADKSIKFVSSRLHQITPLESIEIYTYSDNVRLHNVLESMKENDAAITELVSGKKAAANDIRAYFATVLPDFDQERVYTSDIKKIMKWYELLKANDLLSFEIYNQQMADMDEAVTEEDAAEEEAPKKAAKKAVAKEEGEEKPKKAAKKAVAKEEGEEKPAKKAAKKAVAKEEGEEKPKKAAKKKED